MGSRAPRGVVVVTHLRTLVSGIGWRQWGWENSEWMWKMESAKPSEQLSVGVWLSLAPGGLQPWL